MRLRLLAYAISAKPGTWLVSIASYGLVAGYVLFALGLRHPVGYVIVLLVSAAVTIAFWLVNVHRSRPRVVPRIGSLTTPRLLIRPLRSSDAEVVPGLIDDEITQAIGWPEGAFATWAESVRWADVAPLIDEWMVTDPATDSVVGSVSLHHVDVASGTCHMGWWIVADARGRGYATEAVAATLDALHTNGFGRVTIGTDEANLAVQRILDKVGATFVEATPHTLPDGTAVTSRWYLHQG